MTVSELIVSQHFQELGHKKRGKIFRAISWCWRHTFAKMGEDWIFLALLGFIMAVLSFLMDKGNTIS